MYSWCNIISAHFSIPMGALRYLSPFSDYHRVCVEKKLKFFRPDITFLLPWFMMASIRFFSDWAENYHMKKKEINIFLIDGLDFRL